MVLRSWGHWAVALAVLAACGGRSTLELPPDVGNAGTAGSGGSAASGGAVLLGGTGGSGASGGGVSGTGGNGGSAGALGGTSSGGFGGTDGGTSGAAGTGPIRSDDTSLQSLSLSEGYLAPFFDPHQLEYSVTLPRDTSRVSVKAIPNNPNAVVTVAKELADVPVDVMLKKSSGSIPIVVTAESGATATTYVRYREEMVESTTYVKPSQVEPFGQFGMSVAISGDTLAVGASTEAGVDAKGREGPMGAVYVFVKGDDGWQPQAYLEPTEPVLYQQFGYALALSGDTLVIGAPGESSGGSGVIDGGIIDNTVPTSGAAYVYVRDGDTWQRQASMKAESPDTGGLFGAALALEGDTLVVGASGQTAASIDRGGEPIPGAGAVTVFARDGDTWSLEQTLIAPRPTENAGFGSAVALSNDTIAVGAVADTFEDAAAGTLTWAGAVTVFVKNGTWVEQALLRAPRPTDRGYFGNGLDIEGDYLVVGASGETGPYSDELGAITKEAGAAYVFRRFDADWVNTTALLPSNGGEGHHFGARVALEGDLVAIGAPGETGSASGVNGDPARGGAWQSGAVYVFADEHSVWKQAEYIKAVTSDPNDGFGCSLSFAEGELAVGAFGESSRATGVNGDSTDDSVPSAGAAYVYSIDYESTD